jgi:hypothetical protein
VRNDEQALLTAEHLILRGVDPRLVKPALLRELEEIRVKDRTREQLNRVRRR